jgi:very-short-patch-repair endonuclease
MASPIETSLRAALLRVGADLGLSTHDWTAIADVDAVVDRDYGYPKLTRAGADFSPFYGQGIPSRFVSEMDDLAVFSQVRAAGYRIDIVVAVRLHRFRTWPQLVLVECDGHDWHERTSQQAARDRARDREISAKCGVAPVRFTGSEIFRDQDGCAREVIESAISACGRVDTSARYERDQGHSDAEYAVRFCSEDFSFRDRGAGLVLAALAEMG